MKQKDETLSGDDELFWKSAQRNADSMSYQNVVHMSFTHHASLEIVVFRS